MHYDFAVLMAARDEEKTIADAIRSIFEQETHGSISLAIVDDGSKDGTTEILCGDVLNNIRHENRDSAVKSVSIMPLRKSVGQAKARNIAESDVDPSEYLAFLDADDIWLSNHLESRVKCLEKNKADIVYGPLTDVKVSLKENGELKEEFVGQRAVFQPVMAHDDADLVVGSEKYFLTKQCNIMLPSTVLMKRELFSRFGGFPEGVICGEDGVLWRRLAEFDKKFAYDYNNTMVYRWLESRVGQHQSNSLREPASGGRHLIGDTKPNGQELDEEWAQQMEKQHGQKWKEILKSDC